MPTSANALWAVHLKGMVACLQTRARASAPPQMCQLAPACGCRLCAFSTQAPLYNCPARDRIVTPDSTVSMYISRTAWEHSLPCVGAARITAIAAQQHVDRVQAYNTLLPLNTVQGVCQLVVQ